MKYQLTFLSIILPTLLGLMIVVGDISLFLYILILLSYFIFLLYNKFYKHAVFFLFIGLLISFLSYELLEFKEYKLTHRYKYEYKINTDFFEDLEDIKVEILKNDQDLLNNNFEKTSEEYQTVYENKMNQENEDLYKVISLNDEFIEILFVYDNSIQYSLLKNQDGTKVGYYNNNKDSSLEFYNGTAQTNNKLEEDQIQEINEINEKIIGELNEII